MTSSFLDIPIRSADLDNFSPHLDDDELRDFYPPVDLTGPLMTAKDALKPNAGRAPTVIKPTADVRPVPSWDEQSTITRAREAAAQKERDYSDRLDNFWLSGLRELPALSKQIDDAVAAHNASSADKVVAEDEMLLWAMLGERFGEYVDESVRRRREEVAVGADDGKFPDFNNARPAVMPSRFVTPARNVVDCSGGVAATLFGGGAAGGGRRGRQDGGGVRLPGVPAYESSKDQWASKGKAMVVLPDFSRAPGTG